jgi:hypothetical protein
MLYRLGAVFLVALSLVQPTWAEPSDLPQPDGRPILTVTGHIDVTNRAGQAVFDRDLLKTLPQKRVVTATDWTEGDQVFEGPLLSDLLTRISADGAELRATALNDYSVTIPFSDAAEHRVLLALRRNGEAMRVRDKGPIWVIYPRQSAGSGPGLHNEKMIWQLRQLHVQ